MMKDILLSDDVQRMNKYFEDHPEKLNKYFTQYRSCVTPLIFCLQNKKINCARELAMNDLVEIDCAVYCSCGRCEDIDNTAIYFAYTEELVSLLLKRKPRITESQTKSLIISSCYNGYFGVALYWINYAGENNIQIDLDAALNTVCSRSYYDVADNEILDIIESLISRGANPFGKKGQQTPFSRCVESNKEYAVNYLKTIYNAERKVPCLPSCIPLERICTVFDPSFLLFGFRSSVLLKLFDSVLNEKKRITVISGNHIELLNILIPSIFQTINIIQKRHLYMTPLWS